MLATPGHVVQQGPRRNPVPRPRTIHAPMAAGARNDESDAHFRSNSIGINRSRTLSPAAKKLRSMFSMAYELRRVPARSMSFCFNQLQTPGGGGWYGPWRLEVRDWTDEGRSTGTPELAAPIRSFQLSTVHLQVPSNPARIGAKSMRIKRSRTLLPPATIYVQ